MNEIYTFQRSLFRRFFIRNLVLPFSVLSLGTSIVLVSGVIPMSEWRSFTAISILLIFPILLTTEQLYYSINRKLTTDGETFSYSIGNATVLEFEKKDIVQLLMFKESIGTHFFFTEAKFGVLRLKGNQEIIIPGIMCDNLVGFTLEKSVMKRLLFPSIFIYSAFLSNDY